MKGGETKMDYKSAIEEQIRELQKAQDKLSTSPVLQASDQSCKVAETISNLCREANQY